MNSHYWLGHDYYVWTYLIDGKWKGKCSCGAIEGDKTYGQMGMLYKIIFSLLLLEGVWLVWHLLGAMRK